MRPNRTLLPLNGQLELAGETFFSPQIGLDLEDGVLFLRHPDLGELQLRKEDNLQLRFLDLEIPALLRMLRDDGGWIDLTLAQLFELVTASSHEG